MSEGIEPVVEDASLPLAEQACVMSSCPPAGFWRRVGALIVDSVVLVLVGSMLGLFLASWFMAMGQWGRLVGVGIALAYFSLCHGPLGKGQTIGKRLCKIRVVACNGGMLDLHRAILRSLPIVLLIGLNGFTLPIHFAFTIPGLVIAGLLGFVILGLILASAYLVVFDRPNRRVVHDLIAGNVVMKSETSFVGEAVVSCPPLARIHRIGVGALIALSMGAMVATPLLLRRPLQDGLKAVLLAYDDDPRVLGASIFFEKTQSLMQPKMRGIRTVAVTVQVLPELLSPLGAEDKTRDEKLATELVATLLKVYPQATGADRIRIKMVVGYDIAIASAHRFSGATWSPGEWQRRIAGLPANP